LIANIQNEVFAKKEGQGSGTAHLEGAVDLSIDNSQ